MSNDRLRGRTARLAALACATAVVALGLATGTTGAASAAPAPATTPQLIVGGQVAPDGAWPSQVVLLDASVANPARAFFCSGTLIAPQWVLTANHCVPDNLPGPVQPVQVAVGFHWRSDIKATDRLAVDRVVPHPRANNSGTIAVAYDMSLLHLAKPLPGPYARLISPAQDGRWGPGTLATVSGWGLTKENTGQGSQVLRQVDVPIVSDARCAKAYPGLDRRSNLCAGWPQGGRDACQGDSGGPLWIPLGRQWFQVGVVSSGEGCARPGKPGTYTDIRNLLGFINRTITS